MTSAKEVHDLRKSGKLDEAYAMAQGLIDHGATSKYEIGAYGWCLIALIKRHAQDQDKTQFRKHIDELSALQVDETDTMLTEHRANALTLTDERRRDVLMARNVGGKGGDPEKAIRLFEIAKEALTDDDKMSYGWELFRANQAKMKTEDGIPITPANIDAVKRRLNTYLKLGLPRPDLLHSCMLQQATRLAQLDKLNLIAFVRLWHLENLRPEDFEGRSGDDGKVFPSLAEMATQRASKEADKGRRDDEIRYILPFAEKAMKRFPENIWLKFNVAKLLRDLNRLDEARTLAVEFAHSKAGEYWSWELLGDLETERAMRLSCYAKALSCSEDDAFVSKVRLKLATLLADDYPGQARTEVEHVIECKRQKGENIPSDAQKLAQTEWFAAASPTPTGKSFYNRFKGQAENAFCFELSGANRAKLSFFRFRSEIHDPREC